MTPYAFEVFLCSECSIFSIGVYGTLFPFKYVYFVYFTVKTKLVIRISLLLNDKTIIEKFLKNISVPDLVPVFIRITDQDYGSRIY